MYSHSCSSFAQQRTVLPTASILSATGAEVSAEMVPLLRTSLFSHRLQLPPSVSFSQ